jgi:hypothetical protein
MVRGARGAWAAALHRGRYALNKYKAVRIRERRDRAVEFERFGCGERMARECGVVVW